MGEAQDPGMLAIVVKDNFFFKDILCSHMFRNFMVNVFSTTEYFGTFSMLLIFLSRISYWKYSMESFPDLNGKYCFSWVLPLFNIRNSLGNGVPELETQGLEGAV